MGPKGTHSTTGDLFRQPLVELAELIDWSIFETRWSAFFPSKTARPATPPRLVAGLLYLQHTFACSDEELVWAWVENPYWQYFCGETYFQHEPPIDPSSLTRWRQRVGEEGVEWLLTETIAAAPRGKIDRLAFIDQAYRCTQAQNRFGYKRVGQPGLFARRPSDRTPRRGAVREARRVE